MLGGLALTAQEATAVAEDPSASRRLFDEHAELVRRLAVRLGVPTADADDVVQEVFLVAFQKRATFHGEGDLPGSGSHLSAERAWLYAITVRVAAAARRRAKLRRFLGLADIEEPRAPETPSSLYERAEARRRVLGLLEGMSEKKRTVFLLFELEGLSGQEIARVVGAPLKTVWSRLFHARREFLARLAHEERVR